MIYACKSLTGPPPLAPPALTGPPPSSLPPPTLVPPPPPRSPRRLYGGYECLKGGKTSEAMEDFTGGVTESFDLSANQDGLYDKIKRNAARSSLMSCSIKVCMSMCVSNHGSPIIIVIFHYLCTTYIHVYVLSIIASKVSLLRCSTCPLSVCLCIYIYRTSIIFGPTEALALRTNVSRLIESSKVTYSTDINMRL